MEYASQHKPYFSIVIPAYNREREIQRAINSCLSQPYQNIEIVVVDDASQDNTVAAAKSFGDDRIVVISHEQNRGVCPARNTGIFHSRGKWLIFLDSDDELMPGILQTVLQYAETCPQDIGLLAFLCQWDSGRILPEPVPKDQILDYTGYMKWSDTLTVSDIFQCVRRCTFPAVKFTESRAYEDSYYYDLTAAYKIRIIPTIAVLKYTDVANRITTMWKQKYVEKLVEGANDQFAAMDYILNRHGEALRLYGPRYFRIYSKTRMLYCFLAGRRKRGAQLASEYLWRFPGCLEGWVICMAGLLGPRALATIKRWKYLWCDQ